MDRILFWRTESRSDILSNTDFEYRMRKLEQEKAELEEKVAVWKERKVHYEWRLVIYGIVIYVLYLPLFYLFFDKIMHGYPLKYSGPITSLTVLIPTLVILLRYAMGKFYSWMIKKAGKHVHVHFPDGWNQDTDPIAEYRSVKNEEDRKRVLQSFKNTRDFEETNKLLSKYDDVRITMVILLIWAVTHSYKRQDFVQPIQTTPKRQLKHRKRPSATGMKTPNGSATSQSRTPNARIVKMGSPHSAADGEVRSSGLLNNIFSYISTPNDGFALICKNCGTHNGYVPKEEYSRTNFKCFRCGFNNIRWRPSEAIPEEPRRELDLGTEDAQVANDSDETEDLVQDAPAYGPRNEMEQEEDVFVDSGSAESE